MQHRIASGGVVADAGRILLVRYRTDSGDSYLVCPGGRVDGEENMRDAVEREVLEETGLLVRASRLLMVEDTIARRYRITKLWFNCSVTGGALNPTEEAVDEGIVEARWFRREELESERVFPSIITARDWTEFQSESWQTVFDGTQRGNF